MRKLASLAIIGAALFLMGFNGRLPAPVDGIYSCKLKTLTLFDLMVPKELPLYFNFAELTDSKPENLEIEGIDEQQFTDYRFGSFRIGNNEQKVWFLMAKSSSDYWDEVYIDQNLDHKIALKEKVKNFQTSVGQDHGAKTKEAFTYIPVPIKVSFKGITREYEQTLYFFVSTITFSKKEGTDIVVRIINASFLEGEVRIDTGKIQKTVKYRIIDDDSNGCYNDFGRDLIYMDLNQDEYFQKSESQPLAEFLDAVGNEKEPRQLHLHILPFSLKFAITEVTADFDLSQLEPPIPIETEAGPGSNSKQPDDGDDQKTDPLNPI